jgi:hypothetical protein
MLITFCYYIRKQSCPLVKNQQQNQNFVRKTPRSRATPWWHRGAQPWPLEKADQIDLAHVATSGVGRGGGESSQPKAVGHPRVILAAVLGARGGGPEGGRDGTLVDMALGEVVFFDCEGSARGALKTGVLAVVDRGPTRRDLVRFFPFTARLA